MRGELGLLDDLLDPAPHGEVVGRVVQLLVRHRAKLDRLERKERRGQCFGTRLRDSLSK